MTPWATRNRLPVRSHATALQGWEREMNALIDKFY